MILIWQNIKRWWSDKLHGFCKFMQISRILQISKYNKEFQPDMFYDIYVCYEFIKIHCWINVKLFQTKEEHHLKDIPYWDEADRTDAMTMMTRIKQKRTVTTTTKRTKHFRWKRRNNSSSSSRTTTPYHARLLVREYTHMPTWSSRF